MSLSSSPTPWTHRGARALLFGTFGAVGAHLLHATLGLGGSGLDSFFNDWVYNAVFAATALACLARAAFHPRERAAWALIGAGLGSWTTGEIYWTLYLAHRETIPYPSIADGFYLGTYPALYTGIVLLIKARVSRFSSSLWLDGAIGALAVAALGAAVLYPTIEGATHGSPAAVVTNLAYPLADLLLLSFVVGALALTGWRPERSLVLIAVGLTATAMADGTFLYQEATSSYVEGTVIDTLWLLGGVLIASAAWSLPSRRAQIRLAGLRLLLMPSAFALTAVGLQMYGQLHALNAIALSLATATLFVVIVRMALAFRENLGLLAMAHHEAATDPLTGLRNRRALMSDLSSALAEDDRRSRLFALFDLDGFKAYNDSFGHPAGDALLTRLGANLAAAAGPWGSAYRLGGDEFCVLASIEKAKPYSILAAASAALYERGAAFTIGSSCAMVELPAEADNPADALRVADRKLYAQKRKRPDSAERQTRDVLMRIMQEREPAIGEHLEGVAKLAVALARTAGLDGEELDIVARAAELHDIGKVAIPDELLDEGRWLSDVDLELRAKQSLIGEEILAAAPAMAPVGGVVRAVEERWDGKGSPDGLAGEEIPLSARIVAICEAFTALAGGRGRRRPMTTGEACAELRHRQGSEFDPELVALFCERVWPGTTTAPSIEFALRSGSSTPR